LGVVAVQDIEEKESGEQNSLRGMSTFKNRIWGAWRNAFQNVN